MESSISKVYGLSMRPNKKKCFSGNKSENFRQGRHAHIGTYIFLNYSFYWKNAIICILPFKIHKIIFFFQKS